MELVEQAAQKRCISHALRWFLQCLESLGVRRTELHRFPIKSWRAEVDGVNWLTKNMKLHGLSILLPSLRHLGVIERRRRSCQIQKLRLHVLQDLFILPFLVLLPFLRRTSKELQERWRGRGSCPFESEHTIEVLLKPSLASLDEGWILIVEKSFCRYLRQGVAVALAKLVVKASNI